MEKPAECCWFAAVKSVHMRVPDLRLVEELRFTLRGLRRKPASPVVAILVTGLAIGVTTTIVSVAHGVLVRPLPWHQGDRLVRVSDLRKAAQDPSDPVLSNLSYLAWTSAKAATVDGVALWSISEERLTIAGEASVGQVAAVSPNLHQLLGVEPFEGSLFAPEDGAAGRPRVAIISYGLWRTRFGGKPDAVGGLVRIAREAYTVVGIMPKSFAHPHPDISIWRPLEEVRPVVCGPGCRWIRTYRAVARLRPGVTAAQAASEATGRVLQSPSADLAALADEERPRGIAVVPLLAATTSTVRTPILLLLLAATLLLATAVWNAAGMQLARAMSRRQEVAIRWALGGRVTQLARQFLFESLTIGLAAAGFGVLLAAMGCRVLPTVLPSAFPRSENVHISMPVLAFALLASVVSSLGIGLLPAWTARRLDMVAVLARGPAFFPGPRGRTGSRIRRTLVVGQVAAACLLLVGASLLVRNLAALLRAELGYQAAGVLTARIWLPETTGSEQDELVNELLRRLQTVPGVTSAALGLDAPLDSTDTQRSLMVTAPPHFVSAPARGALRLVTRGYFRTLGTRVVDGRGFLDDDLEARREVVLVNRAFAVQYCGGRAPGSFLEFSGGALAEIVGVVEDVRQRNIAEDPSPGVYRLYRQPPGGSRTLSTATVFVRWTRASSYLASRLQATIRELDTGVAVERVETLEDLRAGNLRQPRMYTVLLGIFALASLVIAVAGLFALVANSVTARWKEIGVRLALGASPAAIITLVLREAAAIALPGIIIGGLTAVGLAQTLSNQLYGVDRYDPVSYLVAPSVVLAVAMLAALTPALRAVRMDAVDVLRCE